jgi:hypothetical protein
METLSLLTKTELANGYNVLYDLEYALQFTPDKLEYIQRLHKKFYKYIPHIEEKQFTLFTLYIKKAILIGYLKELSWIK